MSKLEPSKIAQSFLESHFSFLRGVRAPIAAVFFLLGNWKCLKWALVPWLINLFLVLPLSFSFYTFVVFPWLTGFLPQTEVWWAEALRWLASFFFFGMMFGLTLVTAYLAAILIGAPFHDQIGLAVEEHYFRDYPELKAPETTIIQGVKHSLGEAVKRISVTVPLLVTTLLLGLIPVIGVPLALLFNTIITTSFLTLDAFSMPMDRRNRTMPQKLRWLRENLSFAIGFGLPLVYLPCVFILMPPIAATAGTMIFCEWELNRRKELLKQSQQGDTLPQA